MGTSWPLMLRHMPGVDRGSRIVTPADIMASIAFQQTLVPLGAPVPTAAQIYAAIALAAANMNW